MFGEIKLTDLKVGQQYQYEEKYYLAAKVTLLENLSKIDDDSWLYQYRIRIDEIIFGSWKIGGEFVCSIREGYDQYRSWKFKEVGSPTDYVVGGRGI